MTYHLSFIPKFKSKILDREKRLTVRLEPSEVPDKDEEMVLQTNWDDQFARATTDWVKIMSIEQFANREWEGHKNYKDSDDMITCLSYYYPDSVLVPSTEITVIGFSVTEQIE